MDHLPTPHRARLSTLTASMIFLAIALGATALVAPHVFAQAATNAAAGAATGPANMAGTTVTPPAGQAIQQVQGRWEGLLKVAIVIALFVVPIFVGSWLAKVLRMPEHGWKFAIALGTIAAAAVVVSTGDVKLGPDLSGGITLIYELAENNDGAAPLDEGAAPANDDENAEDDPAATGDGAARPGAGGPTNRDDTIALLINVLTERIDPTGTKEISIRKWGEGQLEIIIPRVEKQELDYIERRISTSGLLVFRITASPRFKEHQPVIDLAERLPAGQDLVRLDDREVARWVALDEKEFPTIEEARERGLVTRMSGKTPQALVMTNDGLDVTGEKIKSVSPDVDETGRPQVSFAFDAQGAFDFGRLTGEHLPTSTGQKYSLGILLDNRLLSAPTIESKITDRGRISGGGMSDDEVTFLVGILQAGRLPAALNKVPISRAQISPTLGEQTIEKGKMALGISLALVAAFMLFYYRGAGIIAVIGLAVNMLLIVGSMVLIKAAFTLPGLAGLVLTVGMSVDANVLIYERIREELKRGAALRMAIRNGFDRATTTIIDANVTNLITGIVIYKIAPDNVKGFGITLVLGIAMSIFVAVFLTRIAFDVAERKGLLKTMKMRQFIGETNFDFLKWRRVCFAASLAVIAVGLLAVAARRDDLLDIDFTGGSSVQFVLQEGEAIPYDDVQAALQETSLKDKNLSIVRVGDSDRQYTVTTVNDNVREVEQILTDTFAGKLETYQVEVTDVAPVAAEGAVGATGALSPTPRQRGASWLSALPAPLPYVTLLQAAAPQELPTEGETTDGEAAETPSNEAAEAAEAEAEVDAEEAAEAEDAEDADDTGAAAAEGAAGAAAGDAPAEPAAGTPPPADPAAVGADTQEPREVNPFAAGGTSATIKFGSSDAAATDAIASGVTYDTLEQLLVDALKAEGHEGAAYEITNPDYEQGSARNFDQWSIKLALPQEAAQAVLDRIEGQLDNQAVFPLSNTISGRVASRMATDAIAAIILCLAGIIGYVWFRFHGVFYGLAAVAALIHDVLVALGFVALSAYLVSSVPWLANALMIDKFQISLTLVAAFLTIIGYSLNDTIVIFDRIREVKGKSQRLTPEMINAAVNQTFARTLLTSFTALISVAVLYVVGGVGIHAFAFALLVGFIAGVYSTIFIANPVLLWLAQRGQTATGGAGSKAA